MKQDPTRFDDVDARDEVAERGEGGEQAPAADHLVAEEGERRPQDQDREREKTRQDEVNARHQVHEALQEDEAAGGDEVEHNAAGEEGVIEPRAQEAGEVPRGVDEQAHEGVGEEVGQHVDDRQVHQEDAAQDQDVHDVAQDQDVHDVVPVPDGVQDAVEGKDD